MADDPYRAYNFTLLIEGTSVGGFVSATGLGAAVDVIEYREAGAGQLVRNLPGLRRHEPLELTYGVTRNRDLWDWFEATARGQTVRRNISVVQFDNDGVTEAHRWNLFDAWPSQFRAGPMAARRNEVAIESLTLVYDRIERD